MPMAPAPLTDVQTPDASAPADAPDWNSLRARVARDLPAVLAPGTAPGHAGPLEACIFDVRRFLIDELAQRYAPDSIQQEDMLRESLPPLDVTPGPFIVASSPWHATLVVVPGFAAGAALLQGVALSAGLEAQGLALAGGMLGMAGAFALTRTLQGVAVEGAVPLPWGSAPWTSLCRWARWGLAGGATLALLRDFMTGRAVTDGILVALEGFLSHGQWLAVWGSVYTALLLAACFVLGAFRTPCLDRRAFVDRLLLAARNWWAGASCAAAALVGAQTRHGSEKHWRQVGRDLYSLAGELTPDRRQWLEERLHLLGLEAPHEEGQLIWNMDMYDRYDPLGHLEPGDACYVDMPPLLENGRLLRKGTMRKVRH